MTLNEKKRLIGLTGGIASGKSTVAARLVELGAFVVDADDMSRRITEPGSETLMQIEREFPGVVKNGALDRAALAGIVFHDASARARLNALTHPAIIGNMHRLAEEYLTLHPDGFAFLDMSLLIETGDYKNVGSVWLVTAPDGVRAARIVARDGCTEEQARARMAAQMQQLEKESYADVIIDNSGTLGELIMRVDALYRELTSA